MEPQISEFSYGYAVVEELVKKYRKSITSAPFFPSLRAEGKKGGGYDVKIERRKGFPLFIQFKLSHMFVRNTTKEVKQGKLQTPFFRFYLMNKSKSNQHNMLVDLDNKKNIVYYSAPYFITQDVLNEKYLNKKVIPSSIQIKPRRIGKINDNQKHHISFKEHSPYFYIYSDPKAIEGTFNSENFYKSINVKLESNELDLFESIRSNNELLLSIISNYYPTIIANIARENFKDDEIGINRLIYLSRFFFGTEVLIINQ